MSTLSPEIPAIIPPAPARLRLDGDALVSNWRWLDKTSGSAACGACVKANGYGLGASEVMARLARAGCRDFYVATWAEAAALMPLRASLPDGVWLSVFHGVGEADMEGALAIKARPVLCTPEQVMRWRSTGRECDVMVDTGMNRLGVSVADVEAGLLDGLELDTLMSHLASADEDVPLNDVQRAAFAGLAERTAATRLSLANSAGICLGYGYHFDLTRPGLALYGGVPRAEAEGHIRPVVQREARVIQRRTLREGDTIGYNCLWTAERDTEVAIVNLGYADGYFRGFTNSGMAWFDGAGLPVIGRVSMDLTALDVTDAADVGEGDWIAFDDDLSLSAAQSGMSQYELLTSLGRRFERVWH